MGGRAWPAPGRLGNSRAACIATSPGLLSCSRLPWVRLLACGALWRASWGSEELWECAGSSLWKASKGPEKLRK
eukprot:12054349-Alexandrium_andersonii.AAC.1